MITYTIDDIDFKNYGVYVKESKGVIDGLKIKTPLYRTNWPDYHGEAIDVDQIIYEPRDIELDCFIKAGGMVDFSEKANSFLSLFSVPGLRRLSISIDPNKPLCYQIYIRDSAEIKKKWNETQNIGHFTLKLREPEPVKRLVKFTSSYAEITISGTKYYNIYWGDGQRTLDVLNTMVSHDYLSSGPHFAIISGNIEEIVSFSTNGQIVWDKF